MESVRMRPRKRLLVCCDGTWMDSDDGFMKPTKAHPLGSVQSPSNVTRISRCFKRTCSDGTLQVISYESGVGTGSAIDTLTGGLFGQGLSERVREAYSYICANYTDGDEIILVGFSRGAFTVRSVAGMIGQLGLLTREGVESFYPIFKDMQNWMDPSYKDPFPTQPFSRKPKGPDAADEYRHRLERMGLTRVYQQNGSLIKIKAVCVWDTVGSLGIPQISWLNKLGVRPSNEEWHDTDLSDRIEHAFQALALDETRSPFTPAVWERRPQNRLTTDLRQVWFPGNHGNCGGGWDDQSMSNITLAWMMDQMASVGVEFDPPSLERVFKLSVKYFVATAAMDEEQGLGPGPKWAVDPIYRNNDPVRPWALGAIQAASGVVYKLAGNATRTPGLYKQTDPRLPQESNEFLQDTNERIHSSVRVRMACQGLGLNDKGIWRCPALAKWKLKKTTQRYKDPSFRDLSWCLGKFDASEPGRTPNEGGDRWIWVYAGSDKDAPTDPKQSVMLEEPLGPYERWLLRMSGGSPNVYEYAERRSVRRRAQDVDRRRVSSYGEHERRDSRRSRDRSHHEDNIRYEKVYERESSTVYGNGNGYRVEPRERVRTEYYPRRPASTERYEGRRRRYSIDPDSSYDRRY